ncbi:MAG: hypothetical protein ABL984_02935 [Pyrinomonadaceae bacterium]
MVQTRSLKVRFLSLFVTVFICLNGAGAACVAYCQSTMDAPEESADHCPLKKLSGHCNKEGENPSPSFSKNGSDADCCPMTVSFFAGPIEKHSFSVKQPAAAAVIKVEVSRPSFASLVPLRSAVSYRGPPPIDRRPDRIKHQVLLI